MEKFLPEKITAYLYSVEERGGSAHLLITKQHFLKATEIASNLGISNPRIIKKALDNIERYPKYYYSGFRYRMRVYSPTDIFVFIDYVVKNYEETDNGLAICGESFKLAPKSPLREYIFEMGAVA